MICGSTAMSPARGISPSSTPPSSPYRLRSTANAASGAGSRSGCSSSSSPGRPAPGRCYTPANRRAFHNGSDELLGTNDGEASCLPYRLRLGGDVRPGADDGTAARSGDRPAGEGSARGGFGGGVGEPGGERAGGGDGHQGVLPGAGAAAGAGLYGARQP